MTCPPRLAVTVVWFRTITVHTPRVGHALPAVLPLVPQPAPALPRVVAGPVLPAAVVSTHRLVTEYPFPALVTHALQWLGAPPVLAPGQGAALRTVGSTVPPLTLALPWSRAEPVVLFAVLVTLGGVAEHPRPPLLAPTLEALLAVAILAAWQLDTVPAAGSMVAQVTLALPWLHTIPVLGVTLGSTHGDLASNYQYGFYRY